MNACSSGGQHLFTFGDWSGPESGQLCNSALVQLSTTVPVQTKAGCHSPTSNYAGVFDLTGNVGEWEDSCDSGDLCHVRGGSFEKSVQTDLGCGANRSLPRNSVAPDVGFRCCD